MEANPEPPIKIQRENPEVMLPQKARPGAAGYDVYIPQEVTILAESTRHVPLGLRVKMNGQHWMQLHMRSVMATMTDVVLKAGVIDPDYDGEIFAVLQNPTTLDVTLYPQDPLLQLTVHALCTPLIQLEDEEDLMTFSDHPSPCSECEAILTVPSEDEQQPLLKNPTPTQDEKPE